MAPTVSTIRSVVETGHCGVVGCSLDVFFERLEQSDQIVAASLKVEFKGEFGGDSREFVTVYLNGAQIVQGFRSQRSGVGGECMPEFETCLEDYDVLPLVQDQGITVRMDASEFVDVFCQEPPGDVFAQPYMMRARVTLTFECTVAADETGCVGTLPPSVSPVPTISPLPTSIPTIFPSAGPTKLSSIGTLIFEDVCSFAGCTISESFGPLQNADHIINATLKVEFRGEFSASNEVADLLLNDTKVNTCRSAAGQDCLRELETCTEINVLPLLRQQNGLLDATLDASDAVGDFLCTNELPNYAMRARFTLTFECRPANGTGIAAARSSGCVFL